MGRSLTREVYEGAGGPRFPARAPCETDHTTRFIVRVLVNAFAIWVVTLITALQVVVTPFPPGETLQLVLTLLAIAAVFALVNTFIGTVIKRESPSPSTS